ncbi:hypothetical protein LXL04_004170 [Taraxacum kok-saghyz]
MGTSIAQANNSRMYRCQFRSSYVYVTCDNREVRNPKSQQVQLGIRKDSKVTARFFCAQNCNTPVLEYPHTRLQTKIPWLKFFSSATSSLPNYNPLAQVLLLPSSSSSSATETTARNRDFQTMDFGIATETTARCFASSSSSSAIKPAKLSLRH